MGTNWQQTRNEFMRHTGGDLPSAHLEDRLIERYETNPDMVERAMEKIQLAHKAGKIRSPWGALSAELERAAQLPNPERNTGTAKAKAVQRAEQWIRTAGIHYDRETEIEDELFGERGYLRAYPDTQEHVLEVWGELRPLAIAADQERDEFYAKRKEQRPLPPEKKSKTDIAAVIRDEIKTARAKLEIVDA